MAQGVNVKMGVTGVAQFKSSINQAKQNMKTLDAQLALTEKQYKATGDAETYMQQKTEQLQAKLAEQKAVAASAEKALADMTSKGVDKGSKAFQEMLRTLTQAKGDILDTESALQGVADKADEAGDQVDTMNYTLQDIGKNVGWQNVTDGLDRITSGMKGVITKAWDMGKAIVQNTLGAGQWADELATTAAQYEITPEELYRMRETARLIDTDSDTILAARDKLKKGLEGADKDVMGLIAAAGFDPKGMSTNDIFWKLGEYIAGLGSEEDKVKQSTIAFGKSWRELLPLFAAGRKEYDATMESWSWIGDEGFESLTKMDDEYQKLESEWEAFQRKFEAAMAPALTEALQIITDLLEEFNTYLASDEGQEMLQAMGDALTALVKDLMDVDPDQVMEGLKGVFDQITGGMKWIADNKDGVVNGIKAFVGAWALLEGAKGVSTALLLFNGLKGLGSGKAAAAAASGGAGAASSGGGTAAAATGGGAWATMKSFFATGGGWSMLTPAAAFALGVTPAILANNYDRKNAAAKQASRVMNARNLAADDRWFLEESANALGIQSDNRWGNYAEIEALLMGMKDRSDLQKAQLHNMLEGSTANGNYTWNELMRLWGGEEMDMGQLTAILESVTDAYDKMAQEAEASQNASDEAGDKISDAAKDMSKLPGETADAVRGALNGAQVVIDGAALTGVVGQLMAQYVANS